MTEYKIGIKQFTIHNKIYTKGEKKKMFFSFNF